jgi:hypothetical protein
MIFIATYCPTASRAERKKKKEEEKMHYFLSTRLYTPYTLEKIESRNPEQKNTKKRLHASFRARARQTNDIDYYYYYVHAVVFATRGFEYPDLTDEIFQNHSLHASTTTLPLRAITRTYTYTHTHALLDVEVRCLIYYTLS